MTISADHIVGEKETIRIKRFMDFVEEELQFHKMMEALDCEDDWILPVRFPGIDVEGRKLKSIGDSLFGRSSLSSSQHFRIEIQALELKVPDSLLEQPLSKADFRRRVPGADAENPAYLLRLFAASPKYVGSKHLDGVSESEGLNDGNQMFVGPIVHDRRKFVNVGSA